MGEVGSRLIRSVGEHVIESLLCLLVLGTLLFVRKPLLRQYTAMSAKVGRLSTDNIGLTIASVAIVGMRVLPFPFLMFAVAWFLNNASQPTAFTNTVAQSLTVVAPFFFNILLFSCAQYRGRRLRSAFRAGRTKPWRLFASSYTALRWWYAIIVRYGAAVLVRRSK